MPEPSNAQKAYLLRQKRDRQLVFAARILIFLGFLALWEISARLGWIDSFIFSSPTESKLNTDFTDCLAEAGTGSPVIISALPISFM